MASTCNYGVISFGFIPGEVDPDFLRENLRSTPPYFILGCPTKQIPDEKEYEGKVDLCYNSAKKTLKRS
jgi:hypothetical protein